MPEPRARPPVGVDALARKYSALARLRARRDEGGSAATRDELRALASEFPGALRELDTLGPAELARRATACATAAAGGPREPWMAWIASYHDLVAGALAARAATGPGRAAASGRRARGQASPRPPGGRVNVAVLRALSARFGVPAEEIARALFPLRRPSPYRL